jgi:hypothetical protein
MTQQQTVQQKQEPEQEVVEKGKYVQTIRKTNFYCSVCEDYVKHYRQNGYWVHDCPIEGDDENVETDVD